MHFEIYYISALYSIEALTFGKKLILKVDKSYFVSVLSLYIFCLLINKLIFKAIKRFYFTALCYRNISVDTFDHALI